MESVKKVVWGICAIIFVVLLLCMFKFGIDYSKSNGGNVGLEVSQKVDKIVSEIVLKEVKDETGRSMQGMFVNTTGYDIPSLDIYYNVIDKNGKILREKKINYKDVKNGESINIKINIDGMFDVTVNIASGSNVGL